MLICAGAHYLDLIGRARKSYSHALEPVCRKWDLTHNALDIVLFLYNNPEYDRAADIVSRRGIAKSHVSLSVMGLERRGLLTRCLCGEDRRTAHLKLTQDAATIAREGREAQERFFAALYQGISETELEQWRHMMEKMRANMEQIERDAALKRSD